MNVLNKPQNVRLATNKLRTFQRFRDSGFTAIPSWTTDKEEAKKWVGEGSAVVARTVLDGHSGAGIVLCDSVEQVPNAPLYTQYVKKQKEFRVHVAFGNVIDVQEKRRSREVGAEADNRIRNHHTGWVYCREEIAEPERLRETAIAAIAALGLDFGAVDLIWNQKKDLVLVLEVNTACGLEGQTLLTYTNLLMEKLNAANV